MSDLTELGQDAIAEVSRGVADGAPLVKCQLLASAFYEALRHELRKADASRRSTLLAVTDQCHRSAAANISPVQALAELKRAIDLLQPGSETVQRLLRSTNEECTTAYLDGYMFSGKRPFSFCSREIRRTPPWE
jgi:Effector-associated domain 2